ncbi:thiamine pyrophosphate-dependent enzyme [Microbulbifer sp. OS29]|uniref:Thiamine pyrophosphate-dependent enzyme n=1 Tax=Microbulbifer okhotskensis TaxID=2926617 RepID=A0A9X2J608_9GAMM|nr:thiamine pyrophosphate-dependent enzyme [Microbulbifer okhotskensis]MCO1334949.1 thiamine pyrophosphate-dependent enzyme [Microbulbifer okhotskensis]
MQTVSEVIVDTLVKAGAKRCYGIVGDTINHFTSAVRTSDLEWVHVRHEEVGAFAAGGESYLTGELSVCAGTAGPGSLHFINGIFESHRNGAPVLLIASRIDRAEQGFGYPQDVDQQRLYEQCSVFCETLTHPEQARRMISQAAQAALNRRGVAVVQISGDIFKEKSNDVLPWSVHRPVWIARPSDSELDTLAKKINQAKNITIYGGIGCRFAHDETVKLAQHLAAPIAHTTRSKEFLEYDNPCNVGMNGILGNPAGYRAIMTCDLLLCLGTDFAYTQFYPEKATIIQIDSEAPHLGRRTPLDMGLVGHVGATIEALLPRLKARTNSTFLDDLRTRYAKDLKEMEGRGKEPDPSLIHPQFVAQTLDKLANDDAVFTADGGSPMVWLLRHLRANGKRSFLTSLSHGTMANAYPQGLGMAKAYPGRQVIAMCGDGGMTMLMGDLLTLVQEKIPLKVLVFNNHSLGFVEMEQRIEGLLDSYTGLHNPDFGRVAEACGITGTSVESADQLEESMQTWLAAEGPALLSVQVNRVELVMPPEVTAQQISSTALFGLKAILSGRGDEVVDLLRDNFLR